ncbi:MAG: ADP compounds hydrolase NudE [Pseudomonadota bacterium]
MQKPPKISQIQTVAQSHLFRIESLKLEFSNGAERQYERLSSKLAPAVMVIPFLDAETIVLIREYGAGLESYYLSFPKGGIEPGESLEEAANRELMEEIGYGARSFRRLYTLSSAPSYSGGRMDIVVAEGLYPAQAEGDEPEPLEVVHWPIKDIDQLLIHPEFHQAAALAALMLLQYERMTHSKIHHPEFSE